jgi:hypothetical protein
LDERTAIAHFLGKDRHAAFALFKDNPLHYADDLSCMGSIAFRFYFPSFAEYLRSSDSDRNSDALNALVGLVERRLDAAAVEGAEDDIRDVLEHCHRHYEKFDVDPQLYGDLRGEIERLLTRL